MSSEVIDSFFRECKENKALDCFGFVLLLKIREFWKASVFYNSKQNIHHSWGQLEAIIDSKAGMPQKTSIKQTNKQTDKQINRQTNI